MIEKKQFQQVEIHYDDEDCIMHYGDFCHVFAESNGNLNNSKDRDRRLIQAEHRIIGGDEVNEVVLSRRVFWHSVC